MVAVVYFLSFAVGLGYAIIVGLSGHLFGGDAVDGHMEAGTDLALNPLSPTIISTFLGGFGGGGLLANNYYHLSIGTGIIVALLTGLALSAGTFGVLTLLFRSTQAGSEFSFEDMVGQNVQVVTPIPESGVGEIALIAKGMRSNCPARSVDGKAIGRNQPVTIVRVVGNVFYVKIVE